MEGAAREQAAGGQTADRQLMIQNQNRSERDDAEAEGLSRNAAQGLRDSADELKLEA